eukprot:TRINITY_DN5031_c0_g1_i2.p1 TRINITY_DN5031_c0_g1~~TRINITY_DN5031_c0_g1_i2.p1  ORF type:complete len:159 (+),score=22.41 TRINITY_DN5031_c0_g1_i2:119-595(+)
MSQSTTKPMTKIDLFVGKYDRSVFPFVKHTGLLFRRNGDKNHYACDFSPDKSKSRITLLEDESFAKYTVVEHAASFFVTDWNVWLRTLMACPSESYVVLLQDCRDHTRQILEYLTHRGIAVTDKSWKMLCDTKTNDRLILVAVLILIGGYVAWLTKKK